MASMVIRRRRKTKGDVSMSIGKNENVRAALPNTPITDSIHIDVTQIPDHVRDRLAAAALDLYKSIINDPKTRDILKRRTEERRAAAVSKR